MRVSDNCLLINVCLLHLPGNLARYNVSVVMQRFIVIIGGDVTQMLRFRVFAGNIRVDRERETDEIVTHR